VLGSGAVSFGRNPNKGGKRFDVSNVGNAVRENEKGRQSSSSASKKGGQTWHARIGKVSSGVEALEGTNFTAYWIRSSVQRPGGANGRLRQKERSRSRARCGPGLERSTFKPVPGR